jgi:chemotaxis-related protein WspB
MLFIQFQIGSDRYALEARSVVEVIPLLGLKQIPQTPRGVAGLFNYRGEAVPALDLVMMTTGQPAAERLSTRIIVVRLDLNGLGPRLVGVIAEHATGMLRRNPEEFVNTGITPGTAPFLGPVLLDDQGVIQWVQEQKLLPEKMRRQLFAPSLTAANGTD